MQRFNLISPGYISKDFGESHHCELESKFLNIWGVPTENGESRTDLGELQGSRTYIRSSFTLYCHLLTFLKIYLSLLITFCLINEKIPFRN